MRFKMKKKYIIFFLIGIFSVMAIAFAAFSTTLNITGTASIDSNWKIKINMHLFFIRFFGNGKCKSCKQFMEW